MNLFSYIIPPEGIDWRQLLAFWIPPLPENSSLWFVNRFGDAFLTASTGEILRLEVGTGTCGPVARNRNEFAQLLDQPVNLDLWLRPRLVDDCVRSNMVLGHGECYGFKIPPALQGAYEVANLTPTKLDAHYSWMAHLSRQDSIYWIEP